MSDVLAVVPLVEHFCSLMVATAIVCHQITDKNNFDELSAQEIVDGCRIALGSHAFSTSLIYDQFSKHPDALHQGFKIFKKGIESRNISVIEKKGEKGDILMQVGVCNIKLRVTAVVTVSGTAKFAPYLYVIHHSAKVTSKLRPDQSHLRVIQNLFHANNGFGVADGWELHLWVKELCIDGVTAIHKCWYIINSRTGHVVTSQHKAWNDTVRMAMWVELVMGPIKERDGKMLIWFDNCGSHKTFAVEKLLRELGIDIALLPPNMTDILQVLDLVVNGPLKRHIRTLRAKRIVQYFKQHKIELSANAALPNEDRKKIPFCPPKPTLNQAMTDLIDLLENEFSEDKFKQGVIRTFQRVGNIPNDDGSWALYERAQSTGTMKFEPTGTIDAHLFDLDEFEAVQHNIIESAVDLFLDAEVDGDVQEDTAFEESDDEH